MSRRESPEPATRKRAPAGRGRRPGGVDTRSEILSAARAEFAGSGFERATMRSIAARAGVDPSLIVHYFGSKDSLFRAAVEFPVDPESIIPLVLAAPLEQRAWVVLEAILAVLDSPAGAGAQAIFRSATDHEWSSGLLREFFAGRVLGRIAPALPYAADEAVWRLSLAASQISGVVFLRYVLRLEPLASAPPSQIVEAVAPNLQRYLTGPLVSTPA